jgi:hypothetical protein
VTIGEVPALVVDLPAGVVSWRGSLIKISIARFLAWGPRRGRNRRVLRKGIRT